tara:strand:+ start:254 stop:1858 length:1605 start_codon:yes stop_codon:yes gene_type:complete
MQFFTNNKERLGSGFLIIGIIVWFSGLAGRDLYLLPILIGMIIISYQVLCNKSLNKIFGTFFEEIAKFQRRTLLLILFFHGLLMVFTGILKLYSFQWNIWDVGIYSDILFNTSKGNFYSSYNLAHSWGGHFTPSMSFISIFYLLSPSSHWMTLCKVIAIIISPILIWKICKNIFSKDDHVNYVCIVLSLFWLYFYAPIVNSSNFAFHPSALAAPAIFYAFLCLQNKNWWKLLFIFIFLLGLKEHLGSVLIGFGLYMLLNTTSKKSGILFIISGVFAIVLIMWIIMPYYRGYVPAWTTGSIDNISLFEDTSGKLIYLMKLLLPFAFLPLIYWKYGIIAGPAIGVNLLAIDSKLYSTGFHYDDLSSPLLFISTILCIDQIIKSEILMKFWNKKLFKLFFLCWLGFLFPLLPESPMRIFWGSIPSSTDVQILRELKEFDYISKGERIALQSSIGAHFLREKINWYTQKKGESCEMTSSTYTRNKIPVDYVVLVPLIGHYGIQDMKKCINELSTNSNAQKISGFSYLLIYKNLKDNRL